jgi:hypothetical protein
MISTPADLTTWVRDLFEGDVLPPQQKKELQRLVAVPGANLLRKLRRSIRMPLGLASFR